MAQQSQKSGQNKAKEAWDARALLEKYGFETVAEMEAALMAVQTDKSAVAKAVEPPAAERPVAVPDAEVVDDLGWITRDTGAVHLVARYQTLCLRPPQTAMNPPIDPIAVYEHGRGPWGACPFDMRSRNHEQEILNYVRYGTWSHLAISADIAEAVYSDPRWPIPEKAVVSAREFRGWDPHAKRGSGVLRVLKEKIPLREATRRVLQRFPGEVFIDAAFHRDMPDLRIANPYGNRLAGLVLKLPHVVTEGETK